MSYKYLDDIATADAPFEAWESSLENLFISCAEATINVMIKDLDSIEKKCKREISLQAKKIDLLLFNFLEEFIFYKDADNLLLKVDEIKIEKNGGYRLTAQLSGEEIDYEKHEMAVDVKSVTFHHFSVQETEMGWKAKVILDT